MRFRPATGFIKTWVLLALFGMALTVVNLRHDLVRNRTGWIHFNEFAFAAWIAILFVDLYAWLFSRIEFEPNALCLRRGFNSTRILYSNIVALRAVQKDGRPVPDHLEIEIAPIRASIYPHNYLVIAVSDPSAVMHAIHDRVPTADYEPAG